jgi:hypothetical protein
VIFYRIAFASPTCAAAASCCVWCTKNDLALVLDPPYRHPGVFLPSQVKSIHKQQTTIRKPIECAPEASSGGRESMEMAEGVHLT